MQAEAALQLLAKQLWLEPLRQQIGADFAQLRFARGLRNGWEFARAEAAILNAVHASAAQGLSVSAAQLRRSRGDGAAASPTYQLAEAAWAMQSVVMQQAAPLNLPKGVASSPQAVRPYPQLLSQMWLATRADSDCLTPFGLDASELAQLHEILNARAEPLLRAGLAWAHLVATAPPGATWGLPGINLADPAGGALAALVLTRAGTERTATLLLHAGAASDPASHQNALAAYADGTLAGVNQWLRWWLESCLFGARAAQRLAQAVLAGSPWDGFSA